MKGGAQTWPCLIYFSRLLGKKWNLGLVKSHSSLCVSLTPSLFMSFCLSSVSLSSLFMSVSVSASISLLLSLSLSLLPLFLFYFSFSSIPTSLSVVIVVILSPFFHSLCLKLRCDTRFQHAFTACGCVFKEITLVWANKVLTLKMQLHAVNACWKRLSQLSFSFNFSQSSTCLDWSAKVLLESTWNKIHKKTDTMTRR